MTIDTIKDKILKIQSEIYSNKLSDAKRTIWLWWLKYYQNKLSLLNKTDAPLKNITDPQISPEEKLYKTGLEIFSRFDPLTSK